MNLDEMKALYEQGHTLKELAHRYNTSYQTIGRRLASMGVPTRGNKKTEATRARLSQAKTKPLDENKLHELRSHDKSTREIAQVFGVSEECVRERMIRLGIPRLEAKARPDKNYFWKGGRAVDGDGYILVKALNHPYSNQNDYVREHRLVMEQMLGRYLLPTEVVHHINNNHSDNRPENLKLYKNNAAHLKDTLKGRVPQWSEDGERRILDGLQRGRAKLAANQKKSRTGEHQ